MLRTHAANIGCWPSNIHWEAHFIPVRRTWAPPVTGLLIHLIADGTPLLRRLRCLTRLQPALSDLRHLRYSVGGVHVISNIPCCFAWLLFDTSYSAAVGWSA